MEQSRWSFKQCSHWEETSQGNIPSRPLEINTLWEVEWISGDLAQESYELVILVIALKHAALLYEHLYSLFIIRNTVWKQRFQTSLLALHAWREDVLTLFFWWIPKNNVHVDDSSVTFCLSIAFYQVLTLWSSSEKIPRRGPRKSSYPSPYLWFDPNSPPQPPKTKEE